MSKYPTDLNYCLDNSGLFFCAKSKSVENNGSRTLYNGVEVIDVIKIPDEVREEKKMPAGGYVCRIVKATTGVNRYDEPCLLLYLDVDEGEFKNYFGRIYERRLDRGLDVYPCVYKQSVGSRSTKHFDRLINAITASNSGYVYTGKAGEDWDESELEKLLVGVVFQEKEFVNSRDKVRVIPVPYALKSVEAIRCDDFVIPARRYE